MRALIVENTNLNMTYEECGKPYEFNTILVREIKETYLYTWQSCGFVERLGQYFVSDELLSSHRKILIDNSDNDHWKLA